MSEHRYEAVIRWTGNLGTGTSGYRDYSRDHVIQFVGKPELSGSSDLSPRGNPSRYNPDELLVASLSACHMLWYLHLCSVRGIVIVDYRDEASGILKIETDGGGRFERVTLRPRITISQGAEQLAIELHEEAHRKCFIANSVNFPVDVEPTIRSTAEQASISS